MPIVGIHMWMLMMMAEPLDGIRPEGHVVVKVLL
jgi:hypothetical protein